MLRMLLGEDAGCHGDTEQNRGGDFSDLGIHQ